MLTIRSEKVFLHQTSLLQLPRPFDDGFNYFKSQKLSKVLHKNYAFVICKGLIFGSDDVITMAEICC